MPVYAAGYTLQRVYRDIIIEPGHSFSLPSSKLSVPARTHTYMYINIFNKHGMCTYTVKRTRNTRFSSAPRSY